MIDELVRLLGLSNQTSTKKHIEIVCGCAFEPHGRASETWEIYWTLTLPHIPYHWRSTTGWRKGENDRAMWFQDRTFSSVVDQTIRFLKEKP